jgi:hypothetical protein
MPLAAPISAYAASSASDRTAAPRQATANDILGAQALIDLSTAAGPVRVHLRMLPDELIVTIASYLPFEAKHRFAQASRTFHRSLLADLRCDRILLRLGRVTTTSTLVRALVDIATLPAQRHDAALSRLARRLHRLHDSMAATAIHALLDAIAALTPERRLVPLSSLIHRLGDVPQSARQPDLQARAVDLALDAPVVQRGPLLAQCLRHLGIATLRRLPLARWLRLAKAVHAEDRAAMLAQLAHVTAFGRTMSQWRPACEQLLHACLRSSPGAAMASWHRAAVLQALAEELECHVEDDDVSAEGAETPALAHAWHTLFDAASDLPPRDAAPVLGALACCLDGAPAMLVEQGWCRLRLCAARYAVADRIGLLVVLRQSEASDPFEPEVWDAVLAMSARVPQALAGVVLSQLARLLMGQATDAAGHARWSALLSRVGELPVEHRLGPLHRAAMTLTCRRGDAGAIWWAGIQAQLGRLDPSERASLLAECARADVLPPGVWDGILDQAGHFPAALQPALLAGLAASGELVCDAPAPARRWSALFRLTQQLEPRQQLDPLMALTTALERLPRSAVDSPCASMAAAIGALPPDLAAKLLSTRALSITDARTWHWCFAQTTILPAVLQPLILSRLAGTAARLGLARMPALALWNSLLAAIQALPRDYRARALLEMPALVGSLPRATQRDAEAQIGRELARMPEADWPAWFHGDDPRPAKSARRA